MTGKLDAQTTSHVEEFLSKNNLTDRQKQIDAYGLALMMIREGAADPVQIARDALAKFGANMAKKR